MGDRAEVSHQLRTSDDHVLGLGYRMGDGYSRLQTTSIGLGPVRLLRRAPHLRCGAACFCRWPARGCWEEGVPAAGGAASRVAGARAPTHGRGLRRGRVHSARPGASCVAGDMSSRPGTFDAVGDGNPVPVRVGCPRLERTAPGRADCPRRRLGCGRPWSPRKRAIRASPAGPQWGGAREPGWKTWNASDPRPHQRSISDKPDLSLVHLRSVQGSGILCGNRSTSYSGRRIPDRSGRPSVAVHQSNRQGRSRAPSSGQVRDDVSRGDQGAPGR